MTPKEFLATFGHMADAPNGIEKLREILIELSICGRLSARDPNDETASVLLAKIDSTRAKSVSNGLLKKSRQYQEFDDIPFALPQSWCWTSLARIGEISPRNEIEDIVEASFVPMRCISEVYGVPVEFETRPWGEIKKGYTHFADNDVVLAKITPCFQNGKSAVMRGLTNGVGAGTTELHVFRPFCDAPYPEYVLLYFKSRRFLQEGVPKMTGSAGQKRVPREYFASNPFPLPPLAEQKRIVAKVDELMALIDDLEAKQEARKKVRTRLNTAALHHLTKAETPKILKKHWTRIADRFELLYDTPETVQALRQTILQLAVQGKLVPQDPNDEPGEQLLKKYAEVKRKIIQKGGAKTPKPFGPIEENEKPFQLPSSWTWARISDIASIKHGFAFKSESFTSETTRFVLTTPGNFHEKGGFRDRGSRTKYYDGPVDSDFIFKSGELIIPMTEQAPGLLGSPAFIPDDAKTYIHNQRLGKLRFYSESIAPEFVFWFFNSTFFRDELAKTCSGTTVRHTSPSKVLIVPFPVCSLFEQRRIVAKVDELMALCDALESKLTHAQDHAQHLTNAIVHHLIEPAA